MLCCLRESKELPDGIDAAIPVMLSSDNLTISNAEDIFSIAACAA